MADLDKLKKINIVELAEILNIAVKKNKAFCYNGHDKNTASLSFNLKENRFKCFGCGDKGSTIDLVANSKRISIKDAIEWLDQNFYTIQSSNFVLRKTASQYASVPKNKGSDYINIYEWFVDNLTLSNNTIKYFNSRKIQESTIRKLGIKQISNSEEIKQKALLKFSKEALYRSGIIREAVNKNTGEIFESLAYWNHIIFPFYNGTNIVYLQGRAIDDGYTKYLNLGGIEQELYNINVITNLKPGDKLFLCEGVMDTLSAIELNLDSIGILGASSFKTKYVGPLLDFEIAIIAHNDLAGDLYFKYIKECFLKHGKLVERVYLPKNINDLNDYLITQNE